MSLKRVEFCQVHSLDQFYQQLSTQVALPHAADQNLDHLYDLLACDLEGPLLLVWHDHDASATKLGYDKYHNLIAALRDAANSRPDMKLVLD